METSKYDILYIDDEQDNLDVFESTFWRDYNLHLASSAQEAFKILEKQKIHLIITDQRMPIMSGVEFLEQIVNEYPEPVRLVLTGYSDLDTIVEAINKGKIFHYITKPWLKADLKRTLDKALESFRLREENEKLLQQLQINNKKLNDLNKNLEQKVEKRTAELQEKNKKLNNTLNQLKKAQGQLIQSEKLASLGTLSAVLGHEINSPIGIVKGGLEVIKNSIDKSIENIDAFIKADLRDPKQLKNLQKSLDLESLTDLKSKAPKLIGYSLDAVGRISGIVKSVRVFIGSSSNNYQSASIHDGIDSTIILLQHVFRKSGVDIEKRYDPTVDTIQCFPALLNQVFMNLFSNAVDAITARNRKKGNITIQTSRTADTIVIEISDNGIGMTADVKEHAFDEFFSTKPHGKGTGLGLSISKNIVDKHQGSIHLDSEVDRGTSFRIKLPINQTVK